MSVHDYAIKHNPVLTTEPTEDIKVKTSVPGELYLPSEHEFFRNQLVYGAEAAQEHIWWVWAFPGYCHCISSRFIFFLSTKHKTANQVIEAAQKWKSPIKPTMQNFLATCSSLFWSVDIGPIFATGKPFCRVETP